MVGNLGWVGNNLDVPPFRKFPVALLILPNSHLPKQNNRAAGNDRNLSQPYPGV